MGIILLSLLTLGASAISTVAGFGMATIMMPLMVIWYPFQETLLFVGIIHWFQNLWRLVLFRKPPQWKIIIPFAVAGIIGTILGGFIIVQRAHETLAPVLGGFLIAYVIFLIVNPTFTLKANLRTALIGGSISGFIAAIFGFRGAIRSAFLSAYDMPKKSYIETNGAIAIAVDTARLATYWFIGIRLTTLAWWTVGIMIVMAWVGTFVGRYLVGYIPQQQFRIFVALCLLLMSIYLIFF